MSQERTGDLDQYRTDSQRTWSRIATTWDRERGFHSSATRLVDDRLVERLDPQPGDTVLELAGGTGETTPALAERLDEGGRLISTDFAAPMVAVARAQSERLGLSDVEHRVLDAQRMDLADSSVDRVACRFGYMLMADPAAALAETRRVLRDSGRLAFAVWATPDRNPWAAIPGQTMVELGYAGRPEPGAPGPFVMADPERIRQLVGGAGFTDPEVEEVPVHWGYADADDHWQRTITLSPSISERLAALSEAERERVRELVKERVEARLSEGPDGMDGVALVVTAE
ncbi:MAG TPA: methyltransferase domain-containing protein [Solirubrobacterales bacterium]|jgi:ubiquinone/menaquinone biosynthesis C-methylase UbiE|nr:methyltransferase domain-containing protein [Solirubrobacterales bacterium]